MVKPRNWQANCDRFDTIYANLTVEPVSDSD